jgi:hypothetical protein
MSVPTIIRPGSIFALLAGGAMLVANLPAKAGSGHGSPVDKSYGALDTPPQQCARRDTYNDVYYVDCATFYRQARDLVGQP